MTAAEPDWLDLRRSVDDAARQESLHLLDDAVARLRYGAESNTKSLLAIDIGAGTGNSALWFDAALRSRLPDWQINWILLDSDQASLDLAATALPDARTICAPISALPTLSAELLSASDFQGSQLLLTCSALFDVLTEADLTAVIRTLTDHDGLGLFLLSIVGGWELDPSHPHDAAIDAAFTAHQHRDGRLGHHAPEHLMSVARRHGLTAFEGPSPWRLSVPEDRTFLNRFLSERLEAAVEEDPALAAAAQDWWSQRLAQLDSGLRVRVDHLDVLIDAVDRGRQTPAVRAATPSDWDRSDMTWAKRALMLAITVALLALTVRVVGAQALVDGWQVLNVWTVLAALGCGFIMTGAQALRWTLLLAHRGTTITWSRALADCYSSSLLNMVLPGGLGGDAARVAVYRHTGAKKWLSPLVAVGAERLSTTTLLFATASFTLIGVSGRLALMAAAVSIATLVVSEWGMRGMDWRHTLTIWLSSALGMAALFVLFLIAMAALGGPVVPVLAVVGLAAMSIPIGVGGWGVRELSVSLIAAGISVSMDTAVTASTGYGLLAVISTLPGIVTVWAAGTRRKRTPAHSGSAANEQPQPD